MRDYAKIAPQFWIGQTGRQIKRLGMEAQLIALYLISNPHSSMLGIYYLPIITMAHEVGTPLEKASKALQSLCEIGFCSYDEQLEYVWVHQMAFFQIDKQLKPNDKRVKHINQAYEALPNLPFLKNFYNQYKDALLLQNLRENKKPFEAACKPLPGLEPQEQEEKHPIELDQEDQEEENEQEGSYQIDLNHSQENLPQTNETHNTLSSPLPFVVSIPLCDDTEFFIHTEMINEWRELYPWVDVLHLIKNIRGWNLANPQKRKTKQGILKHINQWLARENSKASSTNREKRGGFNLLQHNLQVANRWLNGHGQEVFMEGELFS